VSDTKLKQKTSDGKSGWPVRLAMCESAIRKQDEYVFKHVPRFVDIVVSRSESRIKEAIENNELAVGKYGKRTVNPLNFLCEEGWLSPKGTPLPARDVRKPWCHE